MPEGKIIRALSGFYYIDAHEKVYQTRARGLFRKKKESPLVGDWVSFTSETLTEGILEKIHQRKNALVRPPVANVDVGVVVMSAVEPTFSTMLVDRFFVYLEGKRITPILLITKLDLLSKEQVAYMKRIRERYRAIGYDVWFSDEVFEKKQAFLKRLSQKLVVFLGQSGVGKSTMLNQLIPELQQETGEISASLGRGRHTTRQVSLHKINQVWIADTPGFSAIELMEIDKERLPHLFPEFEQRAHACKFRACSHRHEPDCAVKQAVQSNEIWSERYEHYLSMYEEIVQRKPVYQRKK